MPTFELPPMIATINESARTEQYYFNTIVLTPSLFSIVGIMIQAQPIGVNTCSSLIVRRNTPRKLNRNTVFCIVDDTISSKTKPSSRALHPIEDAYFRQSYLKGRQDYGHQVVAVMLSCNGIVLNYAMVMYDSAIRLSSCQNHAFTLTHLPLPLKNSADCLTSRRELRYTELK